jgi:hypothetical protein
VGRGGASLLVIGLAGYLYGVGLDKADKVASSLAVILSVIALVLPYTIRPRSAVSATRPQARPVDPSVGTSQVPPERPDDQAQLPNGIDARGSRGTQINQNGGGIQVNHFTEQDT